MRKNILLLSLLFGLAAAALPALPDLPALPQDVLFRWDPRLWGADAALGWKGWPLFPGVDTVLWASAGGAFQSNLWFEGTSDYVTVRSQLDSKTYYNLNVDWRLGVAQGIVYNPEQDRNLVEFLVLYRGKFHHYFDEHGVLASLPEKNGLLQNSILTGLVFDNTYKYKASLNRRGLYTALSTEFAPAWLGNEALGVSDFWRLSWIVTGYLPVLDARTVSIYLAGRVLLDRIFSASGEVPVTTLASIGALTKVPIGSNPLHALGGALRGVVNDRYDGYVKMVNNFDVRFHFPAWTFFKLFTPMAVAYFDAGVYDEMTGLLRFNPVFCTTGLGVGLYALGFDFILYGTYFINEQDLYWGLGLGVHF
jgi:hypothetical protein